MTWHITDRWDLTGGARWFNRKMDKDYFVELPRTTRLTKAFHPDSDENDWVPKVSLS